MISLLLFRKKSKVYSQLNFFYQALSREVIKIHIKRKFSNWPYLNAAGRGLPWDYEKVQRWVTNIYFDDQGSRSETGREVSLFHSHKRQYCFLIQVINPVRICTSGHEYDETAPANGASIFVCSLLISMIVTKTCKCYGLAFLFMYT